MAYSDIKDPSEHFQVKIYTANNGYSVTVTNDGNSDLKPDLLWVKERTSPGGYEYDHNLFDSSRGVTKTLWSNSSAAEMTASQSNYDLQSFNTDGFTTGSPENTNSLGGANATDGKVAWQWKANGGTITTTPNGTQTTNNMQMATKHQVNSTAGFSICTYQGATSYGSFYHGLGVKPDMIIIKSRTNAYDWIVYHRDLTNTHTLYLNELSAGATNTAFFPAEPNTTQVYCKDHNSVFRPNGADSYLAYCFAEIDGYSKFGSYIANQSRNGPFVYTGFKPAFIMIKNTAHATNWEIFDHKRNPNNVANLKLGANKNNAENGSDFGNSSQNNIDILSNGFKLLTGNTDTNVSGDVYVFVAFAENPFVTSSGVPGTAR